MLNKVHLIGNLGQDPEIVNTASGKVVAKFTLATSQRYKDNSGEIKTIIQWHRIQLWEALAGIAEKYLKKGSKVYLEGRIQYQAYEDKEGVKRTSTDIVGNTLTMLTSYQETEDKIKSKEVSQEGVKDIPLDEFVDDLPF